MSAIADPLIGMLTAQDRRGHAAPGTAAQGSMLTGAESGLRRMKLPFQGGELIVEIFGQPPKWAESTLDALGRLLAMREGWDLCGGRPIDAANVRAAIDLAVLLMHDDTPAPTVVPTSAGGVQLEWHARGIDLEIEIQSPTRISACFEDRRTHSAWEAEQLYDFGRLRDALRELARR